MNRFRSAVVAACLAVVLAASVCAAEAAPPSRCTLAKMADLPVRAVGDKLVFEGAVNGQSVGFMLDTGASAWLITRSTADRLKLNRAVVRGARFFGIGGAPDVEMALVDELRVGDATADRRQVMVGDREIGDGVEVVLGEDFLRATDVEFDLAHKAIRLFKAKDCDATSLAYWGADTANEVAIERVTMTNPRIVLTVEINGQPVRAQLDSGGGASVLNRSDAMRAGVIGEEPGGSAANFARVDGAFATVRSFSIGEESLKDTPIRIADLSKRIRYTSPGSEVPQNFEGTPMLLGADFLQSHRVLVAHSQRKLYFTYLGSWPPEGGGAASGDGDPGRAIPEGTATKP
jgi:predicted aspartyl protease